MSSNKNQVEEIFSKVILLLLMIAVTKSHGQMIGQDQQELPSWAPVLPSEIIRGSPLTHYVYKNLFPIPGPIQVPPVLSWTPDDNGPNLAADKISDTIDLLGGHSALQNYEQRPAFSQVSYSSDIANRFLFLPYIFSSGDYDPAEDNFYLLRTREDPEGVFISLQNVTQTSFNPSNRVVILIHGWLGDYTSNPNILVSSAYLEAAEVNVISVDWSAGAKTCYSCSCHNAVKNGEYMGKFLRRLMNRTGTNRWNYHVIGFSLGGHIAGIASRHAGKVGYLTALDPAGPLWVGPGSFGKEGLQKTDAEYTEVIHTNAGILGYLTPLGHVDFYPNGGTFMPNCQTSDELRSEVFRDGNSTTDEEKYTLLAFSAGNNQTKNLVQNYGIDIACFHKKSNVYLAESIRSGGFVGINCWSHILAAFGLCTGPQTLHMGGTIPKYEHAEQFRETGVYFLRTND